MASNASSRDGHLDAFDGREVVYCHNCENEWYRDQSGLICPRCEGEATEIISRENDPRSFNEGPSLDDYGRGHRPYHDTDSDPDEADIEEHISQGPGGFFGHRTTYHDPEGPSSRNRPRANPDDGGDIIRRFTEMLGDMGGGGQVGRSGPETLFSAPGQPPPRVSYHSFSGPGFSGGVSSFTITSSSGGGSRQTRSGNQVGNDDPFQAVFGDLFRGIGPPMMDRNTHNGPNIPAGFGGPGIPGMPGGPRDQTPADPRHDMASALNQLFATFLNPNAVHGDAVYTQEALDRIISNLMEANPQSNAPPPASAESISKLARKNLDKDMLGPELKGECTICIDDMHLGDEVVVLPCKHWFHDECVVLWLKEHNTCPICRAPIEASPAGQPAAAPPNVPPPFPFAPSSGATGPSERSERLRSNMRQRGDARLESIRDMAAPYDRRNYPQRNSNSPPSNSSMPPGGRARSLSHILLGV